MVPKFMKIHSNLIIMTEMQNKAVIISHCSSLSLWQRGNYLTIFSAGESLEKQIMLVEM